MFSPKPAPSSSLRFNHNDIPPLVAFEIATEYESLRAPRNCPRGIYLTPSPESITKWYGIFFVHSGPYAGSVLRFILTFPPDFPTSAPSIRFESEVYHPLIESKTRIWHARGSLQHWQPGVRHIPQLLHALKQSFRNIELESISEEQAVNKQIWSLYHHSRQTFLSMTSQRALSSSSPKTLFNALPHPSGANDPPPHSDTKLAERPTSPKTPKHTRQSSYTSSSSLRSKDSRETLRPEGEGYVAFKQLNEAERAGLQRKLESKAQQRG